ncbi:MAG: TonB-dependent receptor [Pseudomonadota bacterium]
MSRIVKFKTNLLAFSIISAFTLNSFSAQAVDKKNKKVKKADLEVITVTGIANSQKIALFAKRNADSIMDSIAAEDIGKFPDQNISESLQRIPGITISRVGGEGQQITVRGLGPEHNTVLLNGRVLATENEGREFNFDVLASELMTGVDVYKTPTAKLQEGGIGSTVNMKTARPLDYKTFQAVGSVKGYHDVNSNSTTPQYSGLISNTFMDGKFGLLASVNYYNHKFQSNRAYTDGYELFQSSAFSNVSAASQTALSQFDSQVPGDGKGISMATWYQEDIDHTNRKRVGGTLAAQFQATDNLLLTVDSIYSKLDVNSRAFGPAKWIGPGFLSDVTVDKNGTVVGFNGTTGWGGPENWSFSRPRYAKTKQIGFNADWNVNDQLSIVFDASYSTAHSNPIGREVVVSIAGDGTNLAMTRPTGSPLPTYTFTNGTETLSTLKPNWAATEGTDISDKVTTYKIDSVYELDGDSIVTSILAGASYNLRTKEKIRATTGDGGISCGAACDSNGGFYPSNLFSAYDASGFLGGSAFSTWVLPDFNAITNLLSSSPGYITKVQPHSSGIVKEDTKSAYIQGNLEGELGDMPWKGNVGFRYSQTNVQSIGFNQELLSLDVTNPNEPVGNFSNPTTIIDKGNYSVFLPSANFKLDLQQDVTMRLAAGKTITRPTISLLLLKRDWNLRPNDRTLHTGNPSLKPLMAWNYDLSLSWYINDVSIVSGAVFYKSLSNDFQQSVNKKTFFGDQYTVYSMENKGKGTISGIELAAQYTFSQLPEPFDGLGVSANYTNVSRKQNDKSFSDKSKSYNASVFYEKGPIQAHIVYNYRAGYVAGMSANRGQPKMIANFGQLDASASYKITDNLTLFLEANNITNEKTLSYSIYKERMIQLKDTGSRYALGVRYKF